MTDVCIKLDSETKKYSRCDDFNAFPFLREFCRTPFQWDDSPNAGFSSAAESWLPVSENFHRLNLEAQKGRSESHFEVYKALMALKKSEAGTNGNLLINALSDDILMIRRDLNDTAKQSLISILNFGSHYLNLNFINEADFPTKVHIKLSRGNSFHRDG